MTSNHGPPPSQAVLKAFGLSGTSTPLAGGQGESFILTEPSSGQQIVLKPTRDLEETEFLCEMQTSLLALKPQGFRIAQPLALSSTVPNAFPSPSTSILRYIALDETATPPLAWTATHFVRGAGDPTVNVQALLPASRALHASLRTLYSSPPACIAQRTDRWAWGDRYAWSELPLSSIPNLSQSLMADPLGPWITRLEALLSRSPPMMTGDGQQHDGVDDDAVTTPQLIHGDLSGNLLFDTDGDLPPAIIDFSPYWRPVAFAEAIVAADLLMWRKGDVAALRHLGLLAGDARLQVLVRAAIFRLVTFAIHPDEGFIARNLALMDGEGSVRALEELFVRNDIE